MPNWTLTKFIYSRIKWKTMLVKSAVNATLVVLVAVVVNAITAIENIRVYDKPINQKSFVKCVDHIPASSFKV